MNGIPANVMVLLADLLPGDPHPGAPIVPTAIPVAVDPFPTSTYDDLFESSSASATKLNKALNDAITAAGGSGLMANISTMAFFIADLNSGPQFPMGGYHETEVDFIASEAKVAVMYACYEMRSMARRFIAMNKTLKNKDFFNVIDSVQTPTFLNTVPQITSVLTVPKGGNNIFTKQTDARKPDYRSMFTTTGNPDDPVGSVDFNSDLKAALEKMVVLSHDLPEATRCVQSLGFCYLNGALKAGGFITGSDSSANGVWVGSDYSGGSDWPKLRVIKSDNDGPALSTITGTCRKMANIMALVFTDKLVDEGTCSATATLNGGNGGAGSCAEMKQLLSDAGKKLCVLTSPSIPQLAADGTPKFELNKVGYAFKGPVPGKGVINSQLSVIKDVVATGHRYLITWQNLVTPNEPCGFPNDPSTAKVVKVIVDAITAYETP